MAMSKTNIKHVVYLMLENRSLDHVLGWHASLQDSMDDYGAGRFEPAIVEHTLEWLRRRALHWSS